MNHNLIKRILKEELETGMVLKKTFPISDDLKYHLDNGLTLSENIFRIYSDKYFDLINEVRELYNRNLMNLNDDDRWIVESDLGKSVILENGEKI